VDGDIRFHAELDFPEATALEMLFKCQCGKRTVTSRLVYRHWILYEDDEFQECFEVDAIVCPDCAERLYKLFIALQWGLVEDGLEVE
jgi:hypothetical protein